MKATNIKEPYFSEDVVSFVVAQRSLGRKWKDIRREIGELYGGKTPCARQMLLWFNQWGAQAKAADPENVLKGFKERSDRLRNVYKKLATDSTYDREVATAGKLLQLIDGVASRSAIDRDDRIESIIGILTLIERWSGKSTFDQASAEYRMMRRPNPIAFDDTMVQLGHKDYTDEERAAFFAPAAKAGYTEES